MASIQQQNQQLKLIIGNSNSIEFSNSTELVINKKQLFGYTDLAEKEITGELVFQTGMTGYVETLTDPSYAGQFLVCTYPHQGNYGVIQQDPALTPDKFYLSQLESSKIWPRVLIVSNYVDNNTHYQSSKTLSNWLLEHKVLGITGIDTRSLVHLIRSTGPLTATLTTRNQSQLQQHPVPPLDYLALTLSQPGLQELTPHPEAYTPRILFIDMGAKNSQVQWLTQWFNADIVPYNYNFAGIKLVKYCGIFLSNGPGDPKSAVQVIEFIKSAVLERDLAIPVFGICLGHQVLALSAGHDTRKMDNTTYPGHRGQNIPVLFVGDKARGFITSQNHGYEVILDSSIGGWEPLFINGNDGSNEGIVSLNKPWFSVQFHPEARPGPEDGNWLFELFRDMVYDYARHPGCNLVTNIRTQIKSYYLTPIPKMEKITKGTVLIIGSGGLQIGQAGEFDYSGSQAIKAYKEAGLYTILVNPNIATIQTDMADKVFYVPITPAYIKQIIEECRPEFISVSFGGQTALNTGMALNDSGVLDRYNVRVLGSPLKAVKLTEDRTLFKITLESELNIFCPPSKSCSSLEEAVSYAGAVGFPVLARAGYCLGGQGSGFANDAQELETIYNQAKSINSSINSSMGAGVPEEVLIDKSLRGWKEFELELVRDSQDNCICVCAMENMDPLGVHTGESIVVAPCQTLTDKEYQVMRTMAFRIIRHLGIVGECNIQFCLNPANGQIFVIEMNARLSRSSALASKATGYPLAYVAAKLGLGQILPEITNKITGKTSAFFEPSLDYVVVKIPRWDLDKTPGVNPELGSAMKSVGESMAIGRNFQEALMKAIRSCGMFGQVPLTQEQLVQPLVHDLALAHPGRIIDIFRDIYNYISVAGGKLAGGVSQYAARMRVCSKTNITAWFIDQLVGIVMILHELAGMEAHVNLGQELLLAAKRAGLSDSQLASWLKCNEKNITDIRHSNNIRPHILQIDTVAGEFQAQTNYLYLTYNAGRSDSIITTNSSASKVAVIILGGGCYRIGSSVEFDWCAVTTSRQVKSAGLENIIINNNPETVSTDYDEADRLYFEEITAETVCEIYYAETTTKSVQMVMGVIVSMGGQTPNNIVMDLYRQRIPVLGTQPANIDIAENRYKFSRTCDDLGIKQPAWAELADYKQIKLFIENVGYPVLIRPSYVLSGAGMCVIHMETMLEAYFKTSQSYEHPVVISKFMLDAKEIEVDAVAQNGQVVILAIAEHVENAGVHSGDATLILPAQDLTSATINRIKEIAHKIAGQLAISGPFNIQLMAKEDDLYVIECNVRASRSMPFASKTLGINFIDIATQIMIQPDKDIKSSLPATYQFDRVGVKVPQFSWNKLPGSLIKTSVEMASTGEVACFGPNRNIAFLKALMSAGFRIKTINPVVYIYVPSKKQRDYLDVSIGYLRDIGMQVIEISSVQCQHKPVDVNNASMIFCCMPDNGVLDETFIYLSKQCQTQNIPVLINYKLVKLFCESYYYYYNMSTRVDMHFDVRMPGVDIPLTPKHYPVPLPQHILSPSVIANSLQCVEYCPSLSTGSCSSPQQRAEILFTDKHILSAEQFNRNLLRQLFRRASQFKTASISNQMCNPAPLKNKVFGLLFYTPSTRTRCSYESAIKRLGGDIIYVGAHESSVQKGESVNDTLRTLDSYTDGMIIRTENNISLPAFRHVAKNSIINAGDRDEHPTQALLDLFTIREERGTINNLVYGLVGDCRNGRTIISLAKLLCNYTVQIIFIPEPGLEPPKYLLDYLDRFKGVKYEVLDVKDGLSTIIGKLDIIYMTRVQKERIVPMESQPPLHGLTNILTPKLLAHAKHNALILHPLPRNEELPVSVDADPRAIYFKQMEYGLYLRMALVELMFS